MEPFEPVRHMAEILVGFPRPWWIAGGWAIALFVDHETREQADLEIAVLRHDQHALRKHLPEWRFDRVRHGEASPVPWAAEEWIAPPDHEIHARRQDGSFPFEILLDEGSGDTWKFRRNPEITRPLALVGMRTADGVPFLAPEIVLLFKAKEPRPQDLHDFRIARGGLDEDRRRWLREALARCHPGHPWIGQL